MGLFVGWRGLRLGRMGSNRGFLLGLMMVVLRSMIGPRRKAAAAMIANRIRTTYNPKSDKSNACFKPRCKNDHPKH